MRRIWAANVAIVVCLALSPPPALAQEASEDTSPAIPAVPAVVKGAMDNSVKPWDHRDVSDPRISGDAEFVELTETRWTGSGTLSIAGPDGDWSGPVIALFNHDLGAYIVFLSAEGTGAYEGWAFVATYYEKLDGHPEFDGVIYQGEPPRQVWPEPSRSPEPALSE